MTDETNNIVVEFIPADHWWQNSKWKLKESYTSHNGEVTVPEGFITDGATIPLMFRRLFSPTGAYFGAAIVHDYILAKDWDWENANHQFSMEMEALSIPGWRKALILFAVRSFRAVLRLLGKD